MGVRQVVDLNATNTQPSQTIFPVFLRKLCGCLIAITWLRAVEFIAKVLFGQIGCNERQTCVILQL
jgi:hypothetical protein